MSLKSFVLLAVIASSAFAQTPTVSLLIDGDYPSTGTLSLRSVLQQVSTRKGATFHFGSTYDIYDSSAEASWTENVFSTFFNHLVAENGCKWDATEPTRGVSDLTDCAGAQSYAFQQGATFRGHNTFWHEQTPVRSIFDPYLTFILNFLVFRHGSLAALLLATLSTTSSRSTSCRRSAELVPTSPLGML